jgi:hypothetical protein
MLRVTGILLAIVLSCPLGAEAGRVRVPRSARIRAEQLKIWGVLRSPRLWRYLRRNPGQRITIQKNSGDPYAHEFFIGRDRSTGRPAVMRRGLSGEPSQTYHPGELAGMGVTAAALRDLVSRHISEARSGPRSPTAEPRRALAPPLSR